MQRLIKLSLQYLTVPFCGLFLTLFGFFTWSLSTLIGFLVAELIFAGGFRMDARDREKRTMNSVAIGAARSVCLIRGTSRFKTPKRIGWGL